MVTVSGNPNPTTKYRCEFDNLNCIFANTFAYSVLVPVTAALRDVENYVAEFFRKKIVGCYFCDSVCEKD